MINKNIPNYFASEHNSAVAALPLASHIKLLFLNYTKEIARLEERQAQLVEYGMGDIKGSGRHTLLELERLTRDYKILENEILEIGILLSTVSHMIDKYELWKDESNSVEELKSLL